ncbi:hypothetical protein Rcae01_06371 [Novipirellula caenicola]|uniref:DUF3592 domain-containing protein n=2 Tax=Novipirellula caenicola TaxID=1536901 RepID=A0ABP9W1I4_9BACT
MTTLRCTCGQTFKAKPELAGQIITTPCCNTRVRVPARQNAPAATPTDRINVKCSCGQMLAVARPKGPVEVTCPSCKKRLRLGGTATTPRTQPPPENDNVFGDLPPAGTPQGWTPPAAPQARPPSSSFATAPQRTKSNPQKRLPRLGVLEDGFGTPILIVAALTFLGIFVTLGVYLLSQASDNMALAAASEDWQPTEGKILESGFTVRGIQKRKQAATTHVRYEYKVDNATYTGTTLSFEKQDSFSPAVAEAKLQPYPPGADCTVYYDPQSPSNSVLIKGVQSSNQLYFWLGLASILCGVVMAIDCGLGAINAHRFPPPKVPLF